MTCVVGSCVSTGCTPRLPPPFFLPGCLPKRDSLIGLTEVLPRANPSERYSQMLSDRRVLRPNAFGKRLGITFPS